ncbi:Retrovirus-related Pol polyprotein from transposon RE1 [Vitis vinifera]|uniref:Retrovirus-related Pol polyprotein from transposon RE1 n=1 Tax=Vitis vinifera TaxID=29760 RepID=A0A438DA04_VITVI|nr:Retrovirus-related Pol polyprotein from transposon RE1 [Vitis vinifera]
MLKKLGYGHKRFGQLNFNSLKILCQRKMVQGLPNTIEEKNEVCDGCALGKHHRQSFPKGVAWRAKKVLELIHTDICGPMSTPSQGNNNEKCIFMGYSSQSKGYRLYNLKTNKLIISRDVIFDEKVAWNWEEGKILKKAILVDELQTKTPAETGNGSTSTSSPQDSPRSVPLSPSTESPTSSSVKHHSDGRVQRLKARLVAKGYSQQPGVDFHETFAPVARLDTIRTIIAVAAKKGWLLYQLDIKSAFLNGKLEEEIYVEQPQGFVVDGEENKVYKLKKALYGLKQAPRAWNIEVKLIGHCDSDWGGCIDDMKSTSSYAFSLGSGVISWVSKKQGSVAQSSAEAEYISASLATSQAI